MKKVTIIGAGFSGMSAASFMAQAGWEVTVLEKHSMPGGRARKFSEKGFMFDMGPSWYWMPDVFERYFNCFGKKVSDYYELKRLDPSYRVYYPDTVLDIPADYDSLKNLFESIEQGSSVKLDAFMKEAAYKYEVGMHNLVYKPGRSISEFIDTSFIKGVFKLDVFSSMKKHTSKYFKDPRLIQLMEFPVLFLGALPEKIPALYSLMNFADIKSGTWYPQGGMYNIADAMYKLALELGVKFKFNHDVTEIKIEKNKVTHVIANSSIQHPVSSIQHPVSSIQHPVSSIQHPVSSIQYQVSSIQYPSDLVIAAADYHFIESKLAPEHQTYSEKYWSSRTMAPSCLLFYIGLNKKLKDITHHSLFFDVDFEKHGKEIYDKPQWPEAPLFYVCAPSVTDDTVAPPGCENLFFLIPVAAGLTGDTDALREQYFDMIVKRYERLTGEAIADAIIYKKSYAVSDFVHDYNAFKGNAYGLANTLMQTANLKPSIKSKKVKNLFYTGQLTVPGPGVPPSLISGEVVAKEALKNYGNRQS